MTGRDDGKADARVARSRRTCSSSRSTTAATGTATTTSSPTCSRRACWTSSPAIWPTCIVGRAPGTSGTATGPRRSATRWPAEDFDRAADLIELAIPGMRQARQEATLLRWLEALPDELFDVRPVLSVGYAGTSLLGRRGRGRRAPPAGRRALAETPAAGAEACRRRRPSGDGRRRRDRVPPPARCHRRCSAPVTRG